MAEKSTISLKLYIHTQDKKVLFACVSKDFVDFLVHMLSLPLSTTNMLLKEQGMVGSISNLYSSIQNLDVSYIQQKTKYSILNPQLFHANNYNDPLLLPKNWISLYESNLYRCLICKDKLSVYEQWCENHCDEGEPMVRNVIYSAQTFTNSNSTLGHDSAEERGFVKGIVTYIITDNLEVKPMLDFSAIKQILDEFNLANLCFLEEKVVNMGTDQALELLKASMQSQTVLTDVFLKRAKEVVDG